MTVDQVLAEFKEYIKDDTSDTALDLAKNVSEKLNESKEAENWKNKYEENDKAWREKYRDAFLTGTEKEGKEEKEAEEKKTFESLFKVEGK